MVVLGWLVVVGMAAAISLLHSNPDGCFGVGGVDGGVTA